MTETDEPQPPSETEQLVQRRARRPSGLEKVWAPPIHLLSDQNVITSAMLEEGETTDQLTIYVFGEPAGKLEVPAGVGARLLAECGLERIVDEQARVLERLSATRQPKDPP